jgi:hypothetical protein
MMWTLLHRRADGSFVIELNGYPYHVIESDPLFAEVAAAAEGVDLPPEPQPEPPPPPPPPQPTRAELLARLEQIAAQIAALPE